MDLKAIDHILTKTLEDGRLSRGEKQALRQVVEDGGADPAQLAVYRSRAFDLARRAMTGPAAAGVLNWLEEVIKTLSPHVNDPAPTVSHAYFSPNDNCPRRLLELLDAPHERVDICVYTITHDRIARAIIRAHERGGAVRVISDREKADDLGSDIYKLRMAGVNVRVDQSEHHMHHKFAIFDRATLVTGSFNWTRSAAYHNQENLIVTTEPNLVRDFTREFETLWEALEAIPKPV